MAERREARSATPERRDASSAAIGRRNVPLPEEVGSVVTVVVVELEVLDMASGVGEAGVTVGLGASGGAMRRSTRSLDDELDSSGASEGATDEEERWRLRKELPRGSEFGPRDKRRGSDARPRDNCL